jgi:hypothetical protein
MSSGDRNKIQQQLRERVEMEYLQSVIQVRFECSHPGLALLVMSFASPSEISFCRAQKASQLCFEKCISKPGSSFDNNDKVCRYVSLQHCNIRSASVRIEH